MDDATPDPRAGALILDGSEPPPGRYRCRGCDHRAPEKWTGRCPRCGRYYNCVDGRKSKAEGEVSLSSFANLKAREYITTGIPEFDDVLGGGLYAGCVVLLGGPRGVGKSTLLIQTAAGVAKAPAGIPKGHKGVLYTTGEQNTEDIGYYAHRIGALDDAVRLMADEGDIYKIVDRAEEMKPALLIVDSIQTAYMEDVKGDVATVVQLDAIVNWLQSFAKKEKVAVIMIGHVNKMHEFAGSEKIQHLVDALVFFDRYAPPLRGDEGEEEIQEVLRLAEGVRELSIDEKNRGGRDNVRRLMNMTEEGLKPLSRKQRARFAGLSVA